MKAKIQVRAWEADGILGEFYSYTSGSVEPLPKHAHYDYQFGLSLDCQGEYFYRGALHQIPIANLSIIHSGEVHAPSERTYLAKPANFWMMHIHPKKLENMAFEIIERSIEFPFFAIPYLVDRKLNELFLSAFSFLNCDRYLLKKDTAILNFFAYLITRHAKNIPHINFTKPARSTLLNARNFLHEHYSENVTLEELAKVAGLSQFHFCRAFREAIGVSPHAYQAQVRIDRAKILLIQGMSIAQVASETGFYDHSHFGGYFRRLVGVTPSNYLKKSKNFLDASR